MYKRKELFYKLNLSYENNSYFKGVLNDKKNTNKTQENEFFKTTQNFPKNCTKYKDE